MTSRITANPEILGGKPIIRGTRISVELILEPLAAGTSEDDILADYRHISRDDIHACLAHAARSLRNDTQPSSRQGTARTTTRPGPGTETG